jgi:cytoskeletal protein CcmA (bactofilin family)
MNHFDELSLVRYIDNQLKPARNHEIQLHLEECASCRQHLDALERETELLRDSLAEEDEPIPARLLPGTAESLSWVFITVIGLAAVGLYTLWNTILMPWWNQIQSVGVGRETFLTVLFFRGVFWEGWTTMGQNLIQGALILASTLVLFTVARISWRFARTTSVVMMTFVWLVVLALPAQAAVIVTDADRYVLPKGEILENDLIVGGNSVRIEGTLDGDLIFGGQSVIVDGRVTGDVIAFCQRVEINGQVDGSVRTGSQFLDLRGIVGRNVTSGGEKIELHPEGVVKGSVTAGGERVLLDGKTGRDLLLGAEVSKINGNIGGGLLMGGKSLTIGPDASIEGDAKFYGLEEPEVSPQARLASPVEIQIQEETPTWKSGNTYLKGILKWAAAFVFGLVIFLVSPHPFRQVVDSSAKYGMAMLIGAAALVAVPIVAVIVCLTLVGLPIGLTAILLYVVAIYAAQVFVGAWLGKEILGSATTQGQALSQLALGLAIIHIAGYIPYLGGLIQIIIAAWGLGALVLAATPRLTPTTATA